MELLMGQSKSQTHQVEMFYFMEVNVEQNFFWNYLSAAAAKKKQQQQQSTTTSLTMKLLVSGAQATVLSTPIQWTFLQMH